MAQVHFTLWWPVGLQALSVGCSHSPSTSLSRDCKSMGLTASQSTVELLIAWKKVITPKAWTSSRADWARHSSELSRWMLSASSLCLTLWSSSMTRQRLTSHYRNQSRLQCPKRIRHHSSRVSSTKPILTATNINPPSTWFFSTDSTKHHATKTWWTCPMTSGSNASPTTSTESMMDFSLRTSQRMKWKCLWFCADRGKDKNVLMCLLRAVS